MVLDPYTALSLASSVVQFVDFGIKLVTDTREIYHSVTGQKKELVDLDIITSNLSQLSTRLETISFAGSVDSDDEKPLRTLAGSCKDVSEELLTQIRALQTKKPHEKWESFRKALIFVWSEKQVKQLDQKLNSFRGELTLQLIAITRQGLPRKQLSSLLT
jgi:hypothetical protein